MKRLYLFAGSIGAERIFSYVVATSDTEATEIVRKVAHEAHGYTSQLIVKGVFKIDSWNESNGKDDDLTVAMKTETPLGDHEGLTIHQWAMRMQLEHPLPGTRQTYA